jgi:hypothetical protein
VPTGGGCRMIYTRLIQGLLSVTDDQRQRFDIRRSERRRLRRG